MQVIQVAYSAKLVLLVPNAVPPSFVSFQPINLLRRTPGMESSCGVLVVKHPDTFSAWLVPAFAQQPGAPSAIDYKSVWLAVYVVPRHLLGDAATVTWGIAGSFAVIIVVWPFIIPWAYLLGLS